MEILVSTLIILVCILLILIVLVQNPKGGGLSSTFGGGGTQLFGGVKKTTDFLDKGTWVLAIALVVLVLFANVTNKPNVIENPGDRDSQIQEQLDNGVNIPAPNQNAPSLPAGDVGGGLEPEPVEDEG